MGRKQLYRYFEQQTGEISHVKTWIWQQKGNLKRGPESLLIAAQNYTIKVNYIRANINNTQQNSRCRLCGDKNETINHIVSRCNEFAQKEYKSRHNWVEKGHPLGIVQGIEIWPYYQMVYALGRTFSTKLDA